MLGRIPLDFVRESLSMSGFGREPQPNKTISSEKRGSEKFKATRLAADVDVVRFSAPRMFGSTKIVNRNTVPPIPSSNMERLDDLANQGNTASTTATQNKVSSVQERQQDSVVKTADEQTVRISNEKKETVQRTVKRILSGTRLFTKAVNTPRNSYSRTESSQVNRKQN